MWQTNGQFKLNSIIWLSIEPRKLCWPRPQRRTAADLINSHHQTSFREKRYGRNKWSSHGEDFPGNFSRKLWAAWEWCAQIWWFNCEVTIVKSELSTRFPCHSLENNNKALERPESCPVVTKESGRIWWIYTLTCLAVLCGRKRSMFWVNRYES